MCEVVEVLNCGYCCDSADWTTAFFQKQDVTRAYAAEIGTSGFCEASFDSLFAAENCVETVPLQYDQVISFHDIVRSVDPLRLLFRGSDTESIQFIPDLAGTFEKDCVKSDGSCPFSAAFVVVY